MSCYETFYNLHLTLQTAGHQQHWEACGVLRAGHTATGHQGTVGSAPRQPAAAGGGTKAKIIVLSAAAPSSNILHPKKIAGGRFCVARPHRAGMGTLGHRHM